MMKKRNSGWIAAILAAVTVLAGCGAGSSSQQTAAETQVQTEAQTQTEATEQTEAQTEEETEGSAAGEDATEETENSQEQTENGGNGKALVVYYSATGNTEEAANMIAEAVGGDLFQLEPTEPYRDADLNWTDENSRVTVEHDNPDQRDVELVSTTVENWDDYDTVFIGYPIWWGIAAWPVDSFVENNDFTGKTVIPFCTSASSGIGESGQLLAEMAGTGDWQEGMRFRSSVDEADVQEWVNGLGL